MVRIKIEPEKMHREPAQFYDDIGTPRQLNEVVSPGRKDVVALPRINADGKRRADMVQDDGRVGKFGRQIGELWNLRVKEPGVEGQSKLRKAA